MMRKCPNCGNTIKNREICPVCGKKIGLIVSNNDNRPQINNSIPKNNKKSSNPKKNKPSNNNEDNQVFNSTNQKTTNVSSITSSLLGILCIVGVMLIVVSGVLVPDNNHPTEKTTMDTTIVNNATNSTVNQLELQVKVSYNGHWKGSIGLNENLNNYDVNGSETVNYDEFLENDTLSASIQKTESNNDELKVQFIQNGHVLKEGSTKTPYGIVTIAI